MKWAKWSWVGFLLGVVCVAVLGVSTAGASDTETIAVTATPGYQLPPTNLVLTENGNTQVDLTWTKGPGSDSTVIRRATDNYPTGPTDGTGVYDGAGESTSDTGLDLSSNTYYYRAWAKYGAEYSTEYAQGTAGGDDMTAIASGIVFGGLVFLCLGLTVAGFYFKNTLLLVGATLAWFGFGVSEIATASGSDDLSHVYGGVGIIMAMICAFKTIDTWRTTRPPGELPEEEQYRQRLDEELAPRRRRLNRAPRVKRL